MWSALRERKERAKSARRIASSFALGRNTAGASPRLQVQRLLSKDSSPTCAKQRIDAGGFPPPMGETMSTKFAGVAEFAATKRLLATVENIKAAATLLVEPPGMAEQATQETGHPSTLLSPRSRLL